MDDAIWAKIVRSPASSPIVRAILTNSSLTEFKPSEGLATISCTARYAAGAKARISEIALIFEREVGRRFCIAVHAPDLPAADAASHIHPHPTPVGQAAPPRLLTRPDSPSSIVSPAATSSASSGAESTEAVSTAPPPLALSDFNAAEDPLVRQALELFAARIVSVQPR